MRNITITNAEIGNRIRISRKQRKMSMKELGEKVDLHESTVSRYEKGEIQALDMINDDEIDNKAKNNFLKEVIKVIYYERDKNEDVKLDIFLK